MSIPDGARRSRVPRVIGRDGATCHRRRLGALGGAGSARFSRGLDEFWSFERRLERRRASTCTGRRENSRLTRA